MEAAHLHFDLQPTDRPTDQPTKPNQTNQLHDKKRALLEKLTTVHSDNQEILPLLWNMKVH
jgi:hypothetical protein